MVAQTYLHVCFGFLQERALALRFEKHVRHSIERLAEMNVKQQQRCVCDVFDRSIERRSSEHREHIARVQNRVACYTERDVAVIEHECTEL